MREPGHENEPDAARAPPKSSESTGKRAPNSGNESKHEREPFPENEPVLRRIILINRVSQKTRANHEA